MPATSQESVSLSVEGGRLSESSTRQPRAWVPASWLKFAVLTLMLVVIVALLRFPLRRIGSDSQINYNEGWNAYKQALVQHGVPLYGARPDSFTGPTTYPPVSFHLIAWLAGHGDPVRTGRWVSLIALPATGVLIGLIVRELGADAVVAAFSGLLYILGIAVFLPDRLGMNDPQLLGEAFTTAGLYGYVRSRDSVRLLWLSAFAFCLAGFTKQTLLAFPAAAGLDLLLRSRKRFAIWLGAMVVFAALFTALTLAVDGRYFFANLLFHRGYSLDAALESATQYYLVSFQAIMLVAIVWTLLRMRSSPLLAAAFVFANALAFVLAGGDGVDLNIYFNAFAAMVMVCGVAVAEFGGTPTRAEGGRVRGHSGMKAAALMTALFLCLSIGVPDRLQADKAAAKLLSRGNAEFSVAVAVLKATPGPALCENLLLCYRADKPYSFDTFVASDQLEAGALDYDAVPELLRRRKFGAIELDVLPEEASVSAPLVRNRPRFPELWMNALEENYRLRLRSTYMLIFVPK